MKKMILIAAILATGCQVSQSDADKTFRAYGFTNVQLTGYSFFGCEEDNTFRSNFTATGPTGQPVSGAICCGWVFGCHLKF